MYCMINFVLYKWNVLSFARQNPIQYKHIALNLCDSFHCNCLLENIEAICQKVCHDFKQGKSCILSHNQSFTYSINPYGTNNLSNIVLITGHMEEIRNLSVFKFQ